MTSPKGRQGSSRMCACFITSPRLTPQPLPRSSTPTAFKVLALDVVGADVWGLCFWSAGSLLSKPYLVCYSTASFGKKKKEEERRKEEEEEVVVVVKRWFLCLDGLWGLGFRVSRGFSGRANRPGTETSADLLVAVVVSLPTPPSSALFFPRAYLGRTQ